MVSDWRRLRRVFVTFTGGEEGSGNVRGVSLPAVFALSASRQLALLMSSRIRERTPHILFKFMPAERKSLTADLMILKSVIRMNTDINYKNALTLEIEVS